MRIVKEAEERRNEILDAADTLFAQKGFEHTSTGDILTAVGIARGTLYYHFKSKEDIMDALIERYHACILTNAREVAADQSIPVQERIIRTTMALNLNKQKGASSHEILEHIHKPQNALMHQKIHKMLMSDVPPILAELVKEGIGQGIFNTPYPLECMEMLVAYINLAFDDDMFEMTEKELFTRIQAFIFHLERMLGAEAGSMSYVMGLFNQ